MRTHPLIPHLGIALLTVGSLTLAGCGSETRNEHQSTTPNTSATTSTTQANISVKPYPLKTCLVTGNDLGSMGDEQRIVYQGREIKFCCAPCVEKFKKNPDKFLAKLPPN